jgi:hypothetical protein
VKATEILVMVNEGRPEDPLLTYRQLHFWGTRGWIATACVSKDGRPAHPASGTGYVHDYSEDEVRIIHLMARLAKAGIRAERAHEIARDLADRKIQHIGEGIWIANSDPREIIASAPAGARNA